MRYLFLDLKRWFRNIWIEIWEYILGHKKYKFSFSMWISDYPDIEPNTCLFSLDDELGIFAIYRMEDELICLIGTQPDCIDSVIINNKYLQKRSHLVEICRDRYAMMRGFVDGKQCQNEMMRNHFTFNQYFKDVLGEYEACSREHISNFYLVDKCPNIRDYKID